MVKWLSYIFPWTRIKVLEQQNKELREKLEERQEHINKTNAYWKKRVHDLSRKKSPSKL